MFDRFSDSGRTLMAMAREHALRLQHDFIAPGHMLLAVLEEDGDGAQLLRQFRVDLDRLRRDAEEGLGTGSATGSPKALPFTPSARKVLELTLAEATRLGHRELGSGHVVLGMLRLERGLVAGLLRDADVDLDMARLRFAGPG